MRILKKDLKNNLVKVLVQSANDLWILSSIIEKNDLIEGSTDRKIVIGDSKEGKAKTTRKKVFLEIKVEKTDFTSESLKLLGVITKAPDFVPKGEHHSFTLEINDEIIIKKTSWFNYQLKKLEESTKKEDSLLIILFDRERANFYEVTNQGVKKLSSLKGSVSKKELDNSKNNSKKSNFYQEILREANIKDEKTNYSGIIAGSPAFWKDYLSRELKKPLYNDKLKKKFVFTTISDVEKTAIRELLSRPEVSALIKKTKAAKELAVVEEVLKALSNEGLAYGFKEVKQVVEEGNVSKLIITENKILKDREKGIFKDTEQLLRTAEKLDSEILVLSTEQKQIDGLTGLVAIKRWIH